MDRILYTYPPQTLRCINKYHYLQIEKTVVNITDNVKNERGSSITKAGNVTEMLHNSNKAILPSLGFILISQIPEDIHSDTLILNNVHYKPTEKLTVKEQL